jgi:hypothetical protein
MDCWTACQYLPGALRAASTPGQPSFSTDWARAPSLDTVREPERGVASCRPHAVVRVTHGDSTSRGQRGLRCAGRGRDRAPVRRTHRTDSAPALRCAPHQARAHTERARAWRASWLRPHAVAATMARVAPILEPQAAGAAPDPESAKLPKHTGCSTVRAPATHWRPTAAASSA